MKFPLMIEKALADIKAFQTETGREYEQKLLQEEGQLSCRKGCCHCCHYPFLITIIEGLLLYRSLASRGHWTPKLRKAIEDHRRKTMGLSLEVWLLTNIPCPLLEDRLCNAYEARPLHCRATYSLGDPTRCHPHELGVSTLLVPSSEVIIDYSTKLQERMRRLDIVEGLMPLSEALLLMESLEKGILDFDDLAVQYMKDLYG